MTLRRGQYGRRYSGIGRDSEGHLVTKTTLTYGASGEAAMSVIRPAAPGHMCRSATHFIEQTKKDQRNVIPKTR
jgi:hypothetical protein